MASMNVSVPDPMRDWVQSRIESGKFASVSDYVRDLIRKDQAATVDQEQWLAALDASVTRSLDDVKAGRVESVETVLGRLRTKYAVLANEDERR
jgi:antitoxin ParD1/3/4